MRKIFSALKMNILLLLALALIAGCGSGGLADAPAGSSAGGTTGGGTTGGGTTGVTAPATPTSLDLRVSNAQLNSDMIGAPTVTLTAVVKDSGNRAIADHPITFSADSGVLNEISAKTDANGTATAKLGSGGDPTYRIIKVSATAASLNATNFVAVTGTQITIDPQSFSLSYNDSLGKQLVISLKDSTGKAIPGKTVAVTAASRSTFSTASYVTNSSGQITVSVKNDTDTVGDTITASAIGVSAQSTLTINTANLAIDAPLADEKVPINTTSAFIVTYTKNNSPVAGQTIYLTTTRGTLADPVTKLPVSNGLTGVDGKVTVNISSANSGPAVLTAYTTDTTTPTPTSVSKQVSIVFVAKTATKMTLSASPAVINTNTPGQTSEQSLIKAIIRDASDNLVMGKAVDFSIIQDASAGSLAKASATTDMYGTATTNYIAGSVTGGLNNVLIRATVQDTPAVTATTTLTVGGQTLFISLATGPTIQKVEPNKYQKDYVALVTDAAGRAMANAVVTATVTPQYYRKGYFYQCGSAIGTGTITLDHWCQMPTLVSSKSTSPSVPACANEDGMLQNSLYDFNGILDTDPLTGKSEDQNANSRLDPGNVASVTASTTDSTGHSKVSLVYAQDYAFWINVQLEVRASLAGSNTSAFQNFDLPGAALDYTDVKIAPPGQQSPFGSNTTCYAALSVIALDPTRISLNWDPSAYASSYNIYRDKNESPPVVVMISNITKTTYEDNVTAGATYCYEIKQVDTSGGVSPLSPTGNRVCVGSQAVAPANVTATTLSPTQIQISWGDAGAASYRIYRGGIGIRDSVTRSIVDANLSANTEYCYTVSSLTSEGVESTKSSTVCATTQLTIAPLPPTVPVVSATSHTQIAVSWTASAGAAGYRIYRDGAKRGDAAATSFADTGLTPSTQYCYAVSSYDSAGNESAQTAQLCATTQPAPPPVPPDVPTGLTATAVSQSQINLSWTAVTGAANYALYRGGTYWTTVSGTTASDTGLTASTQYCYTIASLDSSGGASAQSSAVCVTTPTPPPPVPTGLTVTPASASQLNIAWAASAGATGYKVYRGGVLLTNTTATTLADTGLSSGTTYCYMISAVNATGSESDKGTQACGATDTIAVPTGLMVTKATSSQINLSWNASAGAAGYNIYKDGTYLKSVTTTSASDMGLMASTVYCYSVSAYDQANNESAKTSQLCATTYGPPPAVPAGVTARVTAQNVVAGTATVSLSWTASAGASEYYIYRNGTKIVTGVPVTGTSYTDVAATINASHTYTVVAVDATGSASNQSSPAPEASPYTGLMLPTLVSLTADSATQITFIWSGGGTKQTGYKVYRIGASMRAMTATSLVDGGLTPDTQYCYSVSATDAAGNESAQTSQLCATTYGAGSMVLSLTKSSDDSATTSVSIDSPAKLTATVKDGAGLPIVGAVVKFSTISDLSFNPASGTALTDATGKVTITVNAGNTTGATTIGAATTDASGAAISKSINLSVAPPNLSLSALTITPAPPAKLSAGGSAAVSITVNDGSGVPFTTSVPISFTSDGVQAGKAAITPQVYTVNGVASATYRDINYATVDTITATLSIGGTTFTKTGTIIVDAASAGSISFISATPANIALKGTGGTGRSETSVVVFKVLDTNGISVKKTVNFSLLANTTVGGLALTAASADSDPVTGLVQTIVQAGTVSTPVRVSATIAGTPISTTSDQLVISTGIPDQDSFSIAVSTHNIEAWNYDGVTSDITVRLADHFNNPAPDGTAVYFRSSGGSIQPSCTTAAGTCKVIFTSQAPRETVINPGRVVILAYALGEESFVDLNGNGIYDTTTIPADTFTDMPEPFLDANEDGFRQATEEFVDTDANGSYSFADGKFNGILRDASLTGSTTIHVRDSITVVLSGSDAVISIDGVAAPPFVQNIPACTPGVAWTPGSVSFNVVVADENGNVMPADTTISFSTTNGTIINTATSYTVPNTSATPPTYPVTIRSDATQAAGPGFACTNTITSGTFTVTVSTPKGIKSYQYVTIND